MYAVGGVAGLYLQVKPASGGKVTRCWIYRYTHANKRRDLGLGSFDKASRKYTSLKAAREAARDARQHLQNGIDPIEIRAAQRREEALERANFLTFAECADRYIASHKVGWKNPKHVQQWCNTISTYANRVIGSLPVQTVETHHMQAILTPIWNTKNETASRLRGRLEAVLDWAKVQGYRTGDNPARWKGHLDKLLPRPSKVQKKGHHSALPYPSLSTFMTDLCSHNAVSARALEFAIVTAARTGEVIKARWEEINLVDQTWTVPAARMKANRRHIVPLSSVAMNLLKTLNRTKTSDYVFPGNDSKPLSNMAMLELLKRMGHSEITVHGFRSTFRDWAGETTSHPHEVIEMALAHTIKNKAEAAYRRGDLLEKRRNLMEDWAEYCAK